MNDSTPNKATAHTPGGPFADTCHIWREELKQMFRDEGVIIFFIVVPLFYPLLYSWIYNNEVVREVPVVAVDDCHTSLSRQFVRRCDALPRGECQRVAAAPSAHPCLGQQGCDTLQPHVIAVEAHLHSGA